MGIEERVRELTENYTKDLSDKDAEAVKSAFGAFREWWDSSKFEPVYMEEQMVSEMHKYGGTPDLVGRDAKGNLVMVDFKTSDGTYTDYLYQLGAYRILHNEVYPDMPLTGGSHLCRFSKENGDFVHHYYPNLDLAEEGFLLMRRLYDIDKELKKRC